MKLDLTQPTVVIGEGWVALATVAQLQKAGTPFTWLSGTGSRLTPPFSSLQLVEDKGDETGLAQSPGLMAWLELARDVLPASDSQEVVLQNGDFLREFRNKAFREATWTKAPNFESRKEVQEEELWGPEIRLAGIYGARFELSLVEIENLVRKNHVDLLQIQSPLQEVVIKKGEIQSVIVGSGQEIPCKQLVFADRWSVLAGVKGFPKVHTLTRKLAPVGVLQATFSHKIPVAAEIRENFFCALHKDAGEEFQRNVWGYFFEGGKKSVWTVLIGSEESEDNHEIAKKLRKIKQTLNRIFVGPEWIPADFKDFDSTVEQETVRFEEGSLYTEGKIIQSPSVLPDAAGVYLLTDGFGPLAALQQVAVLLGRDVNLAKENLTRTEASSTERG
ncbi:hypothetical protein K2X30_03635 [bacterium]|jgi:hypothetical protein|nr:hypothetical protein [bacterium]